MAIGTYTELQTAVGNWLNRTDLTSRIPEFIALAEEHFNHVLRVRQMESSTTDTMSSSTITLPSDFQGFRNVRIQSSVDYVLQYYTPEQQAAYDQGDSGIPRGYDIKGSTVTFFPTADSDYTVAYTYYQSIPALADNSTNWLLTASPGAYLHGSLVQAYRYLKSPEEEQHHVALEKLSLDLLKQADAEDRWSGATLRVRSL